MTVLSPGSSSTGLGADVVEGVSWTLSPGMVSALPLKSENVGVGTVILKELKVFWLYSSKATQKAFEKIACVAPEPAASIASCTSSFPKVFLFMSKVTVPSGNTQALSASLQYPCIVH